MTKQNLLRSILEDVESGRFVAGLERSRRLRRGRESGVTVATQTTFGKRAFEAIGINRTIVISTHDINVDLIRPFSPYYPFDGTPESVFGRWGFWPHEAKGSTVGERGGLGWDNGYSLVIAVLGHPDNPLGLHGTDWCPMPYDESDPAQLLNATEILVDLCLLTAEGQVAIWDSLLPVWGREYGPGPDPGPPPPPPPPVDEEPPVDNPQPPPPPPPPTDEEVPPGPGPVVPPPPPPHVCPRAIAPWPPIPPAWFITLERAIDREKNAGQDNRLENLREGLRDYERRRLLEGV
jgi:hypothetical protein